ncbi:hypothetical protein F5Y14DRAFT_113882 [Nemania sp. NC0429]|nr:hypothetical protein F5Y14DRAFT_113882 [Nemania sp. NC0429]
MLVMTAVMVTMVSTHLLLATLITCTLDARLSLLFGLDQRLVLVSKTAGATLDSAALPLERIMMLNAHGTRGSHGRGRGGAAADDDVTIHAFTGQRIGRYTRSKAWSERPTSRVRSTATAASSDQCCWTELGWGWTGGLVAGWCLPEPLIFFSPASAFFRIFLGVAP